MTELLDKKHHREDFDCGKELLTIYLKTQAGQDIKRNFQNHTTLFQRLYLED